jgi:hypothetical protein
MYIDNAAKPRDNAMPPGSSQLAEGLMLLRASSLKLVRLQLAIERHDRSVALKAVDDLVALDRRLQNYLESVPATGDQLMFRRELDCERAALNEEKLTLGAEVLLRPANTIGPPDSKAAGPITRADTSDADDDWLGPRVQEVEPEVPRRRSRLWLAVVPMLASGVAAAAYFISVPDAVAWVTQVAGALR